MFIENIDAQSDPSNNDVACCKHTVTKNGNCASKIGTHTSLTSRWIFTKPISLFALSTMMQLSNQPGSPAWLVIGSFFLGRINNYHYLILFKVWHAGGSFSFSKLKLTHHTTRQRKRFSFVFCSIQI